MARQGRSQLVLPHPGKKPLPLVACFHSVPSSSLGPQIREALLQRSANATSLKPELGSQEKTRHGELATQIGRSMSMDLEGYLAEIERLWPQSEQSPTRELVELCLEVGDQYPESSVLWYYLGVVMQLCGEDFSFTSDDYLRCFQNSVRCDPFNKEACQELGYVLDVYFDEFGQAEKVLRKAIELGAGHESYYARARVLAEMGKAEDAIDSLSEKKCPFFENSEIQELRTEILAGIWEPARERDGSATDTTDRHDEQGK